MTEYRRGKSSIPKPLKDYAVPLLALFIILIILYSVFSWSSTKKAKDNTNINITNQANWLSIQFNWNNTDASIVYPSWDKKVIDNNSILYKWEKLVIKQGSISFNLDNKADISLDKLWILKYKVDWTLYLESSNLWVKANDDINISMKFANISIKKWSVVSLNQNDVESTIYVLKGMAEVSNLAGVSTMVWQWQKVWVLVQSASNSNIDLSSLKTSLDDYFKLSDWFIQNSWDSYLQSDSLSWSTSTWTIESNSWTVNTNSNFNNYISFNNISDWSYVSNDTIDITWKILSSKVAKIVLDNYNVQINNNNNTFLIKWVNLDQKSNDLVFKIFDSDWNRLSRFVYTIYRNGVKDSSKNDKFSVTNYKLDASKFVFTAPSTTWIYKTYDRFVTIKWSVPKWVWKVVVDWYNLKSFNWITWRYHASVDYNNLKVWTNQYEIRYYDKNWKLIFKNYYTIILKSKKMDQKTISDEAKIN